MIQHHGDERKRKPFCVVCKYVRMMNPTKSECGALAYNGVDCGMYLKSSVDAVIGSQTHRGRASGSAPDCASNPGTNLQAAARRAAETTSRLHNVATKAPAVRAGSVRKPLMMWRVSKQASASRCICSSVWCSGTAPDHLVFRQVLRQQAAHTLLFKESVAGFMGRMQPGYVVMTRWA